MLKACKEIFNALNYYRRKILIVKDKTYYVL